MSFGATFPKLRAAAAAHWPSHVEHAFVEGMRDGSLPGPAFLRYLRQDYLFLIHFARAWALAVTKAETLGEMRACAATVHALIDEEMRLHVGLCVAAGIPEADLAATEEAAANLAYTRYVLDVGHAGDFLDLMAALAPCVLGYGEIGARLLREASETPYRAWIETYGGEDYQETCNAVGALIDGAVARRIGARPEDSPRWEGLVARFATATRLEAGFWDMGLSGA